MFRGNRANKFHDDHCLTSPGAPENTSFTTFCEGSDQVDNLHTCFKNFHAGGLFCKGRRGAMDWIMSCSIYSTFFIHRVAQHIEDTAECSSANRDHDRRSSRFSGNTTLKTISCIHRDGTDPVMTNMLLHLKNKRFFSGTFDLDCFVKFRNLLFGEFHIYYTTQNLYDTARCI